MLQLDPFTVRSGHLLTPNVSVIGVFPFAAVAGDPILVWDGALPVAATDADAAAMLDSDVGGRRSPPAWLNAAELTPLSDEIFWPVIDSLERRTWDKTIDRAARLLAESEETTILRWAQTAAFTALALADAFDSVGMPASDQLHAIGATLAQGPAVTAGVLADPTTFATAWLADASPQVIWIASHALTRRLGREAHIVTTFSARHAAIRNRAAAEREEWALLHAPLAPTDSVTPYRAVRGLVRIGHRIRERVVLSPSCVPRAVGPRGPAASLESFGGHVLGYHEAEFGIASLFDTEILRIRRRTSMPVDQYLRSYATTPDG